MRDIPLYIARYYYRSKDYIERFLHWLNKEADKLAKRFDVNETLTKYCKISAVILFFLFITDIHKFGSWYCGNASFYKKEWFVFVIPLIWVPFIIAAWQYIRDQLYKKEKYGVVDGIKYVAKIYVICFLLLSPYLFNDGHDWLNRNMFRPTDKEFWVIFIAPLVFAILFYLFYLIDKPKSVAPPTICSCIHPEPEWQGVFLPDVYRCKRCKLLIQKEVIINEQ